MSGENSLDSSFIGNEDASKLDEEYAQLDENKIAEFEEDITNALNSLDSFSNSSTFEQEEDQQENNTNTTEVHIRRGKGNKTYLSRLNEFQKKISVRIDKNDFQLGAKELITPQIENPKTKLLLSERSELLHQFILSELNYIADLKTIEEVCFHLKKRK